MRRELVEATRLLRNTDPESVSEAIRLLQNTVYSFSMKVCGHTEDAEDTTQEVLLRSLPHLAKIQEPRALTVWLYTAARNRCWRMRRRTADAPKETLSLDELMPDESELGLLLQDTKASPENRYLQSEQDHFVHKAILNIPPRYRMVLVLHDIEDLDTNQIAKVLDIQPGTVRVRLHRARLSVRKEMTRLLEEIPSHFMPGSRRQFNEQSQVRRRPAECRELFANLSEYLDGKVKGQTCEEMREHLEACPSCIVFIRDLRQAIDRCRTLKMKCESQMAPRLRSMLTEEYLRLLGTPVLK